MDLLFDLAAYTDNGNADSFIPPTNAVSDYENPFSAVIWVELIDFMIENCIVLTKDTRMDD